MRCNSCGSKSDPNRSFCRRCGGAVFVEDTEFAAQKRESAASLIDPAAVQASPDQAPPPIPIRETPLATAARQAATAARRARRGTVPPTPTGSGCVPALLRWVVFLGFIYYVLSAVGLWPDVMRMAQEAANGETVDTRPVVNKFRAIVDLPPLE